jgi:hypothetical protein
LERVTLDFNLDFNRIPSNDLFWEKIQESRQNETISYIVFITGSIFFIVGFLDTITSIGTPAWLLFVPYKLEAPNFDFVSFFLELCGLMFLAIGFCSCVYYKSDREYYLGFLKDVDVKTSRYLVGRNTKAFAKQLKKDQNELRECKMYLMTHYGQNEVDSIYYCKLLGDHWQELVQEQKLLTF